MALPMKIYLHPQCWGEAGPDSRLQLSRAGRAGTAGRRLRCRPSAWEGGMAQSAALLKSHPQTISFTCWFYTADRYERGWHNERV